jgi:phytol kinase
MYFFDNIWFAAFVPATFVVINYISYKKDIIKVMERDDDKKEGLGTVYYALSLLILVIVTFGILNKPILGLISVFIMAYGDGLAAIFGRLIKSKKYKIYDTQKSIAGSATMFIVSLIIVSIYLIYINSPLWYVKSLIISVIITIIEAVSIKGTDNISVPLASLLMLMFI